MKLTKYYSPFYILIAISILLNCEPKEILIIVEDSDPVTDIDGNIYNSVKVGDQIWMTRNLTVSHFRNGDSIPQAVTMEEWELAGLECEPAWCYYNNDAGNAQQYGKLYNWYAVNDPRGISPEGWRIPGNTEWTKFIEYLGGKDIAGFKMKSTSGWGSGGNGDNSSKFSGLPGGGRYINGDFIDIGSAGIWWSSSGQTAITSYGYNLNESNDMIIRGSYNTPIGLSVRSLYCPSCTDDTTSALTFHEKLQNALNVSIESGIGIGVSAAIILSDGEIWIGTSGLSHESTPITPDMLFAAGSIAKVFTGATILQLAEEGKLTLEDSLYHWLDSYPNIDSTITIRQLLNHTSGLYNYVDNPDFWEAIFSDPARVWTPEEIIQAFNSEPVFPKGTDWHYSQTGYNLLRMIIMKISESDISTINKDRFWNPYGLTNTFTSMGEAITALKAHGWADTNGDGTCDDLFSWQRTAYASGIGGELWSTAEDLAKWTKYLFHDMDVLSQSSLDQMLTFHSPCTGEESFSSGYGLSVANFNPQVFNGLEAIGHGGHAPDYTSIAVYLPEYDICMAIMDNTEDGETIGMCITNLINVITEYKNKK